MEESFSASVREATGKKMRNRREIIGFLPSVFHACFSFPRERKKGVSKTRKAARGGSTNSACSFFMFLMQSSPVVKRAVNQSLSHAAEAPRRLRRLCTFLGYPSLPPMGEPFLYLCKVILQLSQSKRSLGLSSDTSSLPFCLPRHLLPIRPGAFRVFG